MLLMNIFVLLRIFSKVFDIMSPINHISNSSWKYDTSVNRVFLLNRHFHFDGLYVHTNLSICRVVKCVKQIAGIPPGISKGK